MATSTPPPAWRVINWDGPYKGQVMFLVQARDGRDFTATTSDGIHFRMLGLTGAAPTPAECAKIKAAITTYTFGRAYLGRSTS